MVIIQARSRRKPSGGLYRNTVAKRTYKLGRAPSLTKVGEQERKTSIPVKGGQRKQRLFEAKTANLFNGKKHERVAIRAVLESPSNRNFVRRNIMTKGTVIDTEKGRARITNRPGQEGTVEAVLLG